MIQTAIFTSCNSTLRPLYEQRCSEMERCLNSSPPHPWKIWPRLRVVSVCTRHTNPIHKVSWRYKRPHSEILFSLCSLYHTSQWWSICSILGSTSQTTFNNSEEAEPLWGTPQQDHHSTQICFTHPAEPSLLMHILWANISINSSADKCEESLWDTHGSSLMWCKITF